VRLFWKMQISILRACPPLCGVVVKYSLGAATSHIMWIQTLFRVALHTPGALITHIKNTHAKKIALSRVTVVITTRCTLCCDKCNTHIPDFRRHTDIPLSVLAEDLKKLFSCVDHIHEVFLQGGEALLHPDLDEIIKICVESNKVGHISILTNGTVFPGPKVLRALRDTKVLVKITRYQQTLQPRLAELEQLLLSNDIRYMLFASDFWYDTGVLGQTQGGSAKRRFAVCVLQLCLPYFHGKLHLCGKSAILLEEGIAPECQEDCIDIRAIDPAAFAGLYGALLKKRVVCACSYCMGQTYRTPRIPVAVQRK